MSSRILRPVLQVPQWARPLTASAQKPAPGYISSILHGSAEAREQGEEELKSHSDAVARGKYVHQIVKHRVAPGQTDKYKQLIGQYYGSITDKNIGIKHIGSWECVVGELDTFVHMIQFEDGYAGFDAHRQQLHSSPEWSGFRKDALPLIQTRELSLAQEFAFLPTRAPAQDLGGVFEFRTYSLKPGALLEWEIEWRRGLEARKQHHEPIGAYFQQLGKLHTVTHIWHYKDLQTRKDMRAKSWSIPEWPETVVNTVKLTSEMKSHIMVAMPFSPLR